MITKTKAPAGSPCDLSRTGLKVNEVSMTSLRPSLSLDWDRKVKHGGSASDRKVTESNLMVSRRVKSLLSNGQDP